MEAYKRGTEEGNRLSNYRDAVLPTPLKDPTANHAVNKASRESSSKSLQQTVAQHRQRQTERARNPYTILIDEPPEIGQYVEIRDRADEGDKVGDFLVQRVQPPLFGSLTLTWHEGRLAKVDMGTGVKM